MTPDTTQAGGMGYARLLTLPANAREQTFVPAGDSGFFSGRDPEKQNHFSSSAIMVLAERMRSENMMQKLLNSFRANNWSVCLITWLPS